MKQCISGAPVDQMGVCTEHGETACVIDAPWARERHWWNPVGYVERLLDEQVARNRKRERSFVVDGATAERRLWLRGVVRFLLALGSLIVVTWHLQPWEHIAAPVLGYMVGTSALQWSNRASAYRSGWVDGRQTMFRNIGRYPNTSEWVQHELEYDLIHVLGIPPHIPDDLEGLDDRDV